MMLLIMRDACIGGKVRHFLGLFAVALVGATTAATASEPYLGTPPAGLVLSGVADFAGGYRDIDSEDEGTGSSGEWTARGRMSIPIWSTVSVQLDAGSEFYTSLNDDDDPKRNLAVGAHLSYRVPSHGLIGVFYGHGRSPNHDDSYYYTLNMVGVEGQLYRDNWTFYGQAGWADKLSGADGEGFNDGWFVRGVTRYFLTPDTKIEAELSYAEAAPYLDGSHDGEFLGWGASFQRKLFDMPNLPLYWDVSYRGARYDATTEEDKMTEHVFKVGLTMLFGTTSLIHNDRAGATLDLPMLPIRANGVAELLD